jgi:hypothetical protein
MSVGDDNAEGDGPAALERGHKKGVGLRLRLPLGPRTSHAVDLDAIVVEDEGGDGHEPVSTNWDGNVILQWLPVAATLEWHGSD